MSDIATKRLSKVAKELNIATGTIIEFLNSKNIEIDSNPNTKISDEIYNLLLEKYQTDKLSKELVESQKEEKKLDQQVKKEKEVTEEKEEILVKSNLFQRETGVIDKPAVPEHAAPEIKESEEPSLKIVGKIELSDKKGKDKKDKGDSKTAKGKGTSKEETPEITKTAQGSEIQREPESIESDQTLAVIPENADVEVSADTLVLGDKDFSSVDEIASVEEIVHEIEESNEEDVIGLKIIGKIDVDSLEEKPKKKKPVASTSDQSLIKPKKRKRIIKKVASEEGAPEEELPKGGREKIFKKKKDVKKQLLDEKEIKEQVSATLAKLTVKQSGTDKSKIKRLKRKELKEKELAEADSQTGNKIDVIEFITVNELANLMGVSVTEVITVCMNIGLMVNINQRLDAETITFVADEFGFEVNFKMESSTEPALEEPDSPDNMVTRAPVVTIMGHVDHGKTTLLDHIRKSRITEGEAGGITQHIGAYEVILPNNKKIAFLDTPGHEAFTSMRARGAKLTDIVIIVVSADDNVMPQTKEAISHAQAAGVPIVFAINKIDREGANPDRIREQLADMNILVEEWGGKYQSQEISAKKGLNIELLLEKVLFEAELLDLKADPLKRAIGTVIEASKDKGRGIVVTALVQKGKLKIGDTLVAGANYCRVKALVNEMRKRIEFAGPSTPVEILGFDGAPGAGDVFYVTENEQIAKSVANNRKRLIREQGIRATKHVTLDEIGRRIALGSFKELNIIIKGDVDGSVEALSDSFQKLSNEEVQVNVIHKAVGQISETDVMLASASDAVIIGFQVRPSMSARKMAESEQIEIRLYSIIYDAIEELKAAIEGMLQPTEEEKILSNIEVRDVFKITKVGTIAGCMVLDGKISRNAKIRVIREGVVIYTGELNSLKRFKEDVKEVTSGYECGIGIHNFNDLKVGDIIEGYSIEQVKRKL